MLRLQRRKSRTVVTEHDEKGRIAEFVTEQAP